MTSKIHSHLDVTDRDYLLNVLNEVLYGIAVDFKEQLHCTRESLIALQLKLSRSGDQATISPSQARLLIDAARLCEAEIEDAEFATRLGVNKAATHHTVARLERRAALNSRPPSQAAAS